MGHPKLRLLAVVIFVAGVIRELLSLIADIGSVQSGIDQLSKLLNVQLTDRLANAGIMLAGLALFAYANFWRRPPTGEGPDLEDYRRFLTSSLAPEVEQLRRIYAVELHRTGMTFSLSGWIAAAVVLETIHQEASSGIVEPGVALGDARRMLVDEYFVFRCYTELLAIMLARRSDSAEVYREREANISKRLGPYLDRKESELVGRRVYALVTALRKNRLP